MIFVGVLNHQNTYAIDCTQLGSAGSTIVASTDTCTNNGNWSTSGFTIDSGALLDKNTSGGAALGTSQNRSLGTLVNGGTIQGTGSGSAGLWVNNSTISQLTNNGTLKATSAGSAITLTDTYGYLGWFQPTITTLTNTSLIKNTGNNSAINNYGGTITTLNNQASGSIISDNNIAIDNYNNTRAATIGTIANAGLIQGSSYGVSNQSGSTITTITNTGSITGSTKGITNAGTITTLSNSQGLGNVNGALTFTGNLPTNYKIIVNSTSSYGKLSAASPGATTTTFSINSTSTIAANTYTSVLQGLTLSNLSGVSGTYTGGYSWTLVNSSGTLWDLVVTGGSNSGGGGSGSGGSTVGNIDPNNIVSLSSIGVSANPVFNGGTLSLVTGNSSSQSFTVNSAGGTIQSPSSGVATLSGIFSGSGGMTFTGTGTTVMNGSNTYSGGTTVQSGTLSIQGSSPTGSGNVYVQNNGTLMGAGTINGTVTVAGILKPGNSPGYLAANNTVTMNNGSIYQQDIAGTIKATDATPVGATGYYSNLNVSGGLFVINSGATLTPRLSNLFTANESGYGTTPYTPVLGDLFRIVTADGGISGKFSTVTQPAELTSGTQFLPFYNMAGSNSVDLALIPTSYKTTIAAASGNKNAQSVGSALDKMVVAAQNGTSTAAQDQLLYAGSTKPAAALSGYAQSLSGEVYPAAVAAIAQTTQRVQQAVMTRLGDTMGIGLPNSNPTGNTGLMATTNTALSGGVAISAVSTNPSVNPNADAKTFSNGNVWGDLAYQYGNRNSDSNSGGWNSNLYQLVFGSDFYTANGMKIGGGLALSSTTLNPTYGSGTIQQGSIFAYGKMPVQEFVVDGMASIGLNSSDLSRGDATGLSNGFKSKSVSGNDALLSLGLSRPIDTEEVRITPYARVTWQIVSQSGVNEGDAASALSVKSFTGNGVRGVIGAAVGSKTNNPMTEKYTYRAYVGVGADSSGLLNPTLNASIGGMGTNITTPNASTTFVQAGLYGTAKFSDNAYAYAGLSGEARSGQTLGAVNVGVRLQF